MRSSLLQRGCVAAVVAVFGAVGWAAVAGGHAGTRIAGGGHLVDDQQPARDRVRLLRRPPSRASRRSSASPRCSLRTSHGDPERPAVGRVELADRRAPAAAREAAHSVLESVSCTSVSFCVAVGRPRASSRGPCRSPTRGTAPPGRISTAPDVGQPVHRGRPDGRVVHGTDVVHGDRLRRQHLDDHHGHLRRGMERHLVGGHEPAEHRRARGRQFNAVSCTGPSNCMAVGVNSVTGTGFDVPRPGGTPGRGIGIGTRGLPEPDRRRPSAGAGAPHITVTSHRPGRAVERHGVDRDAHRRPGRRHRARSSTLSRVPAQASAWRPATTTEGATSRASPRSGPMGAGRPRPFPPRPAAPTNALLGISCISPTSCTAVGTNDHRCLSSEVILTGTWNGSTWTLGTVPTPSDPEAVWFGVSCLGGGAVRRDRRGRTTDRPSPRSTARHRSAEPGTAWRPRTAACSPTGPVPRAWGPRISAPWAGRHSTPPWWARP